MCQHVSTVVYLPQLYYIFGSYLFGSHIHARQNFITIAPPHKRAFVHVHVAEANMNWRIQENLIKVVCFDR